MTIDPITAVSALNFVFNLLSGLQEPVQGGNLASDFPSVMRSVSCSGKTGAAADAFPVDNKPVKEKPDAVLYLDALRKSFLEKGKSPDQVYINKNDSRMLSDFLLECGVPEAKAKKLIAQLFENRSDGMIRLSDFISGAEKLAASEKKKNSSVILDAPAVPKIESALIGAGMTLMQADNLLTSARTEGGGIDIDKLVSRVKLNGNGGREKRSAKEIRDAGNLKDTAGKGVPAGADMPCKIDDLIAGLERIKSAARGESAANESVTSIKKRISGYKQSQEKNTGFAENIADAKKENHVAGTNKAFELPPNVKASIERIMEKSSDGSEKFEMRQAGREIQASWASYREGGKDKTGAKGVTKNSGKAADMQVGGQAPDSVKNDAVLKERGNLIPELKDRFKDETDAAEKISLDKLTAKNQGIFREGTVFPRSEQASSKHVNNNGMNAYLPEQTAKRLGMQISGAIAKGDGILRLQLSPPELGTVNLSVKMKENALNLGIIAENNAAKDILVAGYNDLKNSLANQGIRLETLDVRVGQDYGGSLTDPGDYSGHGRGWKNEKEEIVVSDAGDFADTDVSRRMRIPEQNSLLDLKV